FRSKRRGGYGLDEKVCSFRRTHLRSDVVKRLTFNSGSFHWHIRWRGPKIKRDLLATPFQYLFLTPRLAAPCLLFGRETHASTTQSDPLLLPTRNGPCREDGALHWEYLF